MSGFLKGPWAAKNRWILALGRLREGQKVPRVLVEGVRFGWLAPWAGLARAVNLKD